MQAQISLEVLGPETGSIGSSWGRELAQSNYQMTEAMPTLKAVIIRHIGVDGYCSLQIFQRGYIGTMVAGVLSEQKVYGRL